MDIYFDITELLDVVENEADQSEALEKLIIVYKKQPPCNGHKEDAFILNSAPKLLDMTSEDSVSDLAELIDSTPLYQINMELLLDDALYERHNNNIINAALMQAFDGTLPNTLEVDRSRKETSGSLHHPMLGHIDRKELVQIYIRFMNALARNKREFSFEDKVLGKHTDRFTEKHNGFLTANGGAVKASLLIGFGSRTDHEGGKQLESYVSGGKSAAQRLNLTNFQEMMWAWLEMENFQMRRCRDIDRVLRLEALDRTPRWVTTDIFMLLEKEAIKQHIAQAIMETAEASTMEEVAPTLYKAIQRASLDDVNKDIQILLSQALGHEGRYAGAAGAFAQGAFKRAEESRNLDV